MAAVDGRPVCVIVPSDCEISLKKLAIAFGGKTAHDFVYINGGQCGVGLRLDPVAAQRFLSRIIARIIT